MFRIGEFYKIAQVLASLLHYYDEIRLLKPVKFKQLQQDVTEGEE